MTDEQKRFARAHDRWLQPPDPPEPEVIAECEWTEHPIYEGDVYWRMKNGDIVCEHCFEDYAIEQLGAERRVA